MARYEYTPFPYETPPELKGEGSALAPVAIIGAGPIGLALAVDLATKGIKSVVLDDNNVVSVGSRAICWSKRTLEIFDRLGVGERMLDKGVTWKIGRLFHGDKEVYSFDLLPEEGHKYPAFINLQQYYVEQYLVERCQEFPDLIDLRFKNTVTGHADKGDRVALDVDTPDGSYTLECRYLVACDGAKSPTRQRMGLEFKGQTFEEQFLICDIEMEESPFGSEVAERWFWFEPPFHDGQSTLLHKQPDNIYRIDLQLGPEADTEAEKREENVIPRIKRIVGDKPFTIDWLSIYRFTCARLARFVHDRVIFCGDSAHVVSPFGARGGNGGIQDADNLAWKLAAVLEGDAEPGLLETYNDERIHGSDENILNSTRSTNFMTPKSEMEHIFRDEVLGLAEDHLFARKLINSGRLSMPASLAGFALESDSVSAPVEPGTPAIDAPLTGPDGRAWLLELVGNGFTLVNFGTAEAPDVPGVAQVRIVESGQGVAADCYEDDSGLAFQRYGRGLSYLFRPDAHVAAVFATPDAQAVEAACRRAMGVMKLKAAE